MTDALGPLFDSLAGKVLPGGCAQCHAEQSLEEVRPGVWSLTVAHDDDCPTFRARVGRRGNN
jgi:hypothetical protein